VCPPEQLSALRTLYIGFRTAMLKRTWDSASLRAKTLRGIKRNVGQKDYAKEKPRKNRGQSKSQKRAFKEQKRC
jgi:hypothetical protein